MPIGYTQTINGTGTNGNRTAVLTDIKTKIYGLKVGRQGLPDVLAQRRSRRQATTPCARRARSSPLAPSRAVSVQRPTSPAAACPCDPLLDVWNGGQGKLTFFFVDTPRTMQCARG